MFDKGGVKIAIEALREGVSNMFLNFDETKGDSHSDDFNSGDLITYFRPTKHIGTSNFFFAGTINPRRVLIFCPCAVFLPL